MSETVSTASTRCPEGWRLFWIIGELYTAELMKEPNKRSWKRHRQAVDRHRDHVQDCDVCNFGIKRVRIQLEEMAVGDGP